VIGIVGVASGVIDGDVGGGAAHELVGGAWYW
jgi:hypothetical protein